MLTLLLMWGRLEGLGTAGFVMVGLGLGVFIVLLWAVVGLTVPASAIGEPITIKQSLDFLGPNYWSLAIALALVWALHWLPGLLIALLIGNLMAGVESDFAVLSQLPTMIPVLIIYMGNVASVGVLTRAHMLLVPPAAAALADEFE